MFQKVFCKAMSYASSATYMAESFANKAKSHVNGDKKAQGILEYGLLFVLVALALMGPLKGLKDKIAGKLDSAGAEIEQMGGNSKTPN